MPSFSGFGPRQFIFAGFLGGCDEMTRSGLFGLPMLAFVEQSKWLHGEGLDLYWPTLSEVGTVRLGCKV
jgi:hypothetical protein